MGHSADESWKSAVNGRSGVRRITLLDPEPFTSQIAGEVKDFDAQEHLGRKVARKTDRYTQFAIVAAREAYRASGLEDSSIDRNRLGTIIGSGIGGIDTMEKNHEKALERGARRISPFFCPMMISNMASGWVGIDLNAKGINLATVTACASAGHAIAMSFDAIRMNRADAMVTGGSEAPITLMGLGGFCAMKALSTRNDDPETASRPFDRGRDGFVMAEGGAIVVLEEYEHARRRGAEIYAEVVECGMTCDAHHITAPAEGGEGSARAMSLVLERAGVPADQVDYVNAHGTSTQLNDISETQAIKTALGQERAGKIMVSSTKSVTGHMLGAAGAMELIFTALALKNGVVPPTATLEDPDDGCDLDYVPGEAREADMRFALSNSLGFGGHNVTLGVARI